MTEPPARVRVSADPVSRSRFDRGPALTVHEAATVYSRGLRRAQLRLALGALLAFVVAIGGLTAVIAVLPVVADPVLAGVPLSWLLHAYGYYPVIAVAAALAVRAATRHEQRFQALRDDDRDDDQDEGGDG